MHVAAAGTNRTFVWDFCGRQKSAIRNSQSEMDRVIVGLGNPGERYANNRHNVGFLVVDALARKTGARAWSAECQARVSRVDFEGRSLMLVKPLTFMNRSGEAVRLLQARYGFEPHDLLVVLDDLNLPLGRLRIRERGTAGGHHGLESVLQAMGSSEILRLRCGIGEDDAPADKAEFVLSDFPIGGQAAVNEMIAKACDAVWTVLSEGISKAMAAFNG